ncbi:MAG: ABC transporter permease [Kiritimatiellae bacterium]|nr:ABC transporter permease [Kiritimatiellia bacterium]MDD5519372.1 ABC transporter permease [Kiritimatiellia bacterium]
MRFVSMAFKNLRRRPVRSVLTIAGVALAVAVAVSLAGFNMGYRNAIERSIDRLGFQVMIMAKGCPYEAATMMLKGGTGLLYLPADTLNKVRSDPDIGSITPIFIGLAEKEASSISDSSGGAFAIFAGIEVQSYMEMKPWLEFETGRGFDGGRWFGAESEDEVVMGYESATYEQRKVGDKFIATISPQGQSKPVQKTFKIAGILKRTGTQDDGTVFLPLKTAQKLFNRPDELTILGIKMKQFSGAKLQEFESRWVSLPAVQVVSLQQVKSTLVMLVGTAQTMIAAVTIIAVIVALIGVINAILMSVYERTGEIGVMKAIGAFRGDIFQLIWLETLVICIIGAVAGTILAIAGSHLVESAIKKLINLGVQGSIVLINWQIVAGVLLGAIIVGFFAGLYPAWRAASMHPIDAIREGMD